MSIGPSAGSAHITVRPSLRGWSDDVRRQLRREVAAAGQGMQQPSSAPGTSPADTRAQERTARETGRRAGVQYASSFDREVRTRIARALDRLPPVTVGAATSEAEQKFRDLAVQLKQLQDQRIGVDIDAATALAQLEALRTQLTQLGQQSPDIDVQFNAAGAAAQLTALEREIARVNGTDVDIQADADTAAATVQLTGLQRLAQRLNAIRIRIQADRAAEGHLDGMSRRTRLLLGLFATLGPALLPLGAVLASLAASFTATFTAAAAGIGILLAGVLGAIVPVIKAQGELEQKQKTADAAAQSYAAAQQQVASAARGVADAERSAARSVADAVRAVADARRNAARATAQAEDAVRDAQDRARDAQDALNDARDAAREKLASYRDQLRGAALDESGAALSVTAAREALNNALIDSTSSQLDIDQARQALAEAEFAYAQAGKRGRELRKQAKADRAAGVSGDDAVIDAQERLAEANDDVRQAEVALSEARADGARSVADAERNLARARADGARSVAAAEDQLAQARQSAALAAAANAEAQGELAETMAKLSGPAAIFVAALDRAKAAWREFIAATSEDSFGLAVQFLDMFTAVLPALVPLFRGAARAVGVLLDDLDRFGRGPEGKSFLNWLTRRAPGAIISMGRSIGNLLKGLGYLVGALADSDTGFLRMTRRFARWAKNLDSNPNLRRFNDYVRRMGPVLSDALGAIVGALIAIVSAAAPIGTVVLKAITWIARAIAGVDPEILLAVVGALLAMKVATILVTTAMAAFAFVTSPLGLIVLALAAVVGALIYAYRNVDSFRSFVNKAFTEIKRVVLDVWERYLKPALLELGATATALWKKHIGPAFREIGRIISNAWTNLIKPALKALGWYLTKVLIPVIKFLWQRVVKPYFFALADYIRFVYTRIIRPAFTAMWGYLNNVLIPIIRFLWEKVVRPVFRQVGSAIKSTWEGVIRPVLVAFRDFVRDTLVPAVKRGLERIGEIFDGLKKAAGTPVKFVVDTVYNNGIRKVINAIPGVKDLGEIDTSEWPSFATGGVLPGYTPGRDVHKFVSRTAGVLNLSGGEGILIPQATRQLGGRTGIDYLNKRAREGTLSLRGLLEQSHATGGVVYVDGEPMSKVAAAQLAVAEKYAGYNMPVIQGSYQSASSYSGTSHTGGGVMDTGPGSFDAQSWLRKAAFAAWARNIAGAAYAGSGPHVHSVSLIDPAAAGHAQLSSWARREDGLGHADYGPNPGVNVGMLNEIRTMTGLSAAQIGKAAGGGGNPFTKFLAAITAAKDFATQVPGMLKDLATKGPWAPLITGMTKSVGGEFTGWVNDQIPGPGPMPDVFDRGGLALGAGFLAKRTIRPERVLSPAQTEIFERQIDTLSGWDQSMRALAQITGDTRGADVVSLNGGTLRVLDWDRGLVAIENIALDTAQGVVDANGNHSQRTSAATVSGYA